MDGQFVVKLTIKGIKQVKLQATQTLVCNWEGAFVIEPCIWLVPICNKNMDQTPGN